MSFKQKNTKQQEEYRMLNCLKNIDWKKTGIFAAGVAFGTAGIKALSSDDAKNVYTQRLRYESRNNGSGKCRRYL